MAKINKHLTPNGKRKKTTCPKGIFKSEAQKNSELVLKLMKGYYQIYY